MVVALIDEEAAAEPLTPESAAIRLQRFVRSRKSRRAFAFLTSRETLDRLKALFLDDRAKKAGAEKSPLYSMQALAQRDALRHDAHVVQALADAWEGVCEASAAASAAPEAGLPEALDYTAYMRMSRKLYLACYAEERAVDISPQDFMQSAAAEWRSDSGNSGTLSQEAFAQSWFELADVYTEEVDSEEYAVFIEKISDAIVERDESGRATFRTDAALLNDLRDAAGGKSAKAFSGRRKAWESAGAAPGAVTKP